MKLKDLLSVCSPDWVIQGKRIIETRKKSVPDELLAAEVKEITGFDDGLTIELLTGGSPCKCLPVRRAERANRNER